MSISLSSRDTEEPGGRHVTHLQRKAQRIADVLEAAWGVPRMTRRRPSPMDALVATILSQHTSDRNSSRAFGELKRRYPRWDMLARSTPRAVARAIRAGGLARQKARRILSIVRKLDGRFDRRSIGRRPNAQLMTSLCALDGVGVKTASCVLLFSLGRDVFPVDVHVHRVLVRTGLAAGSRSPEETFSRMASVVPPGKAYSLHLLLVRLGRTLCRPRIPRCGACPLRSLCDSSAAMLREHSAFHAAQESVR